MRFLDRRQAGRKLAEPLRARQQRGALPDPVVLALPRGGVPVAAEVARALDAPLDVLVVRKIGAPFQEEFGVGAITGDDEDAVFDPDALDRLGLSADALTPVVARERAELRRRERLYRHGRPAPDLREHTVIVVDDGLATGVTARAALRSVRRREARRVLLAVPVGARDTVDRLRAEADDVICLHQPAHFMAVGPWYDDFRQLSDADVLRALHTTA
ncbi:phosphoribosyltransferase [Streptomyces sp. NPDC001858]